MVSGMTVAQITGTVSLAQASADSQAWLVYLLFIVAGVMAGGCWSAHKAGNKILLVVTAILTLVAFGAALTWMIVEMS